MIRKEMEFEERREKVQIQRTGRNAVAR